MDDNFVRRFERSQDQQEKDIARLGQEVYSVKSQTEFIQRDITKITTSIEALNTKLEAQGKTNWPAVAAFLSILPMMAVILAMYVAYSISPVNGKLDVAQANIDHLNTSVAAMEKASQSSTEADVNSRTDRAQLNDRLRALQDSLAAEVSQRRETGAAFRVSLTEIETQFCASDIVRNLMHANDLRNISVLWQKLYGSPYPTDNAYYPAICRRDGTSPG